MRSAPIQPSSIRQWLLRKSSPCKKAARQPEHPQMVSLGLNSVKESVNAVPGFDRLLSLEPPQGSKKHTLWWHITDSTKWFVLLVTFSELCSVHVPSVITAYPQIRGHENRRGIHSPSIHQSVITIQSYFQGRILIAFRIFLKFFT